MKLVWGAFIFITFLSYNSIRLVKLAIGHMIFLESLFKTTKKNRKIAPTNFLGTPLYFEDSKFGGILTMQKKLLRFWILLLSFFLFSSICDTIYNHKIFYGSIQRRKKEKKQHSKKKKRKKTARIARIPCLSIANAIYTFWFQNSHNLSLIVLNCKP